MAMSHPDTPKIVKTVNGDAAIDVICLVPAVSIAEVIPPGVNPGLKYRLKQSLLQFCSRFSEGYMVDCRHGLQSIHEFCRISNTEFVDLDFEQRAAFVRQLREQLTPLLASGRPCLSLVPSYLAQAMRRMGLNYRMPLAAMTQRQRLQWLSAHLGMSLEKMNHELFGAPVMYGGSKDAPGRRTREPDERPY